MRSKILLALAALALVASSASAGGQCTQDTQTCLNYLAAKADEEAYIGVDAEPVEGKGYKLTKVNYGSPAEKAGLKAGDIIVALGGFTLAEESEEMKKFWKENMKPGNTVAYTFIRKGKEKTTEIKLVKMPEDAFAKKVGMHMIQHAEMQTAEGHSSDH
jgi:predicted metalloprotease with PDZ domain